MITPSNITYKELITKLRREIWPEGEARNLVDAHNSFFLRAFADIQWLCPILQQNNVSIFPFCDTYFDCAKTVVQAPFGLITRVYTLQNDKWCDPIYYNWSEFKPLQAWAYNKLFVDTPVNLNRPVLPKGVKYAENTTDNRFGRARYGIFALHQKRIYLAPWIQSSEVVVVEWNGKKQEWADTDVLDQTYWNQTVQSFISSFVLWRHEVRFGEDNALKQQLQMDVANERADAIAELAENTRQNDLNEPDRRFPTRAEITNDQTIDNEVEPITFWQLAESGSDDANQQSVATLIAGALHIIHAGNVTASDRAYADVVEAYYSKAIFNSAPGEFDWDLNDLADYISYFGYSNNGRYYELVIGPVHFFFVDTDDREPDGNSITSAQHEWLNAKAVLSPARWKVVVMNGSPYSSGTTYGSTAALQWDFAAMGIDLVISAQERNYEHLVVGGLNYLVNGLGGNGTTPFGSPVAGSVTRYNATYGAVNFSVSCDELTWEFVNIDNVVIDTVTISK